VNSLSLKSGKKEEQPAERIYFSAFPAAARDDANGLKILTEESRLDRHLHLHSHEIISGRCVRERSKILPKIFPKIACGLFLGMGIIGMWWLQWWR
jgi:hypothetical protein